MASNTGQGDIGAQLERLGKLLNELPDSRREAFFKWIEDEEPTPPGGKSPPQDTSGLGLPTAGAVRLAGKKKSTSVAISELLLIALKQHFLDNGIRLSISALVELLLWQFLGCPDGLIEKLPQGYRPRAPRDDDDLMAALIQQSMNIMIGGNDEKDSDEEGSGGISGPGPEAE